MTAEILWNSSMILRLNGRQGQGQGKRSLEARADAFSRLKNMKTIRTQKLRMYPVHTVWNLTNAYIQICQVSIKYLCTYQ